MAAIQLDELDLRLIHLLSQDARVPNSWIASQLGVTEGTVRGRIKRLQNERLIAFTAITGLAMARKSRLAFINIQADTGSIRTVMRHLAEIPEIDGIMAMTGQFNILALCLFDELDALAAIASDRILTLPAVRHIETAIVVRTLKYNARMVKITPDRTAPHR
ncbi:Lrp/AsnC family transcriptional regulator [Sphingomonas sp. KC8]|uniref:Lrp/AsnC family transcriptional regulator n=1 Tax=Sphingomonas sp. KC8 TaxID=1030157 RepID=UPI0002E39FB2|nr:Lrp/AsnC family transcriptional regulator [Sphingomonas sp. KC8]ARS29482.1 AsnC family transcriptional regulator [Sphingomonas sp. KC8]